MLLRQPVNPTDQLLHVLCFRRGSIFRVASFAAMLSVSTNSVFPLRRSPPSAHTRQIPSSSRQLMGRLFSAIVNWRCDSSLPPSIHKICPVPHPLASVPVRTPSPVGSRSNGARLRCTR
eukprot:2640251-Prymnesium_polylepis.1